MTNTLLYVGAKYDYGDRTRGLSYEHRNFHHSLQTWCARQGWTLLHYDFYTRGQELGRDLMTQELYELAQREKPSFLFAALVDFPMDPRHEVFSEIGKTGETTTLHWFCDDHWRFESYSRHVARHFQFVTTTASNALPKYAEIGLQDRVIKTQWACNHELYVPYNAPQDIDVSFVGAPHGDRVPFLNALGAQGLPVAVSGHGWNGLPRLPFHQMVRLFSRSKVNLNLSNSSMHGGQQIKGRNFEVPGAGGFLLSGQADNLGEYYEDGREIVTYASADELVDKARYYLAHDAERQAIAAAGYRRTLAEHTWHHRYDQIFQEIGRQANAHAVSEKHISSGAESLVVQSDDAQATAAEPAKAEPITADAFLHSFRRADLDRYCRSCFEAGQGIAQTIYPQRDAALLYANGVANADSRFPQAAQEWSKIEGRLGELDALQKAGYEFVSRLPEFESQVLPALEVFCRIGAEYHLLAGYLAGRAEVDARTATQSADLPQDSLVSIIVACYNYAHFLPEMAASVLAQTYRNWELIIVNDGSTDDTAEVASALIAAHPDRQIRLINQQNKRLAGARNSGIRAAQGRYILPLDADDMLESTLIARCVAVLDAEPALSMAYTDQQHFDEQGRVWTAHSLDWNFREELHYNQVCICCLFRRSMWKEAGGFRETCLGAEDWDFWITCGDLGHRAWRIPEILFRYRKHGASASVTDAPRLNYLKADIILHHPHLYSEAQVRWARSVAAGYLWLHPRVGSDPTPADALVSVIVPTYNRPRMLAHALESILAQTYRNFEIIVVNDAGEDVSAVIEPLNAEGRITLLNKHENRGQADSRNVGIAAARGKYIAYLDDDDLYYTDHLETLVTFLENTEFQVAYTDSLRAHQRKSADGGGYEVWKRDQPYASDFDYDTIMTGNFIPVQCFMHAKSCLDEVGAFDTTLSSHEDWEMWIRLSRKFDCVHLNKTTSEFSWREDGTSWTGTRQQDFRRTTAAIYRRYLPQAQDSPRLRAHYEAFFAQWQENEAESEAPTAQIAKTDILVVVHNQLDYVQRCLESLYAHTQDFHLFLWDNSSDAPTRNYLEEIARRGNVTLRRSEENLGFIVPNNRLAELGEAPYLILLNSDTEVTAGWDTMLTDTLAQHPNMAEVGYEGGLLGPDALGCGRATGDEIDYVAGWCACLPRSVWKTFGLFDEENLRFAYGEDSDVSLRLKEAGYRIHALGQTRVTHFGNKTIQEVARTRDTRPTFTANHEYLRQRWSAYLATGRVLAQLGQRNGEEWERRVDSAETRFQQGDMDGARAEFGRLLAERPADPRLLNNLGVLSWQSGDHVAAIQAFAQAFESAPQDRNTGLNLADALLAFGCSDDAARVYDICLTHQPDDTEVSALRAALRPAALAA